MAICILFATLSQKLYKDPRVLCMFEVFQPSNMNGFGYPLESVTVQHEKPLKSFTIRNDGKRRIPPPRRPTKRIKNKKKRRRRGGRRRSTKPSQYHNTKSYCISTTCPFPFHARLLIIVVLLILIIVTLLLLTNLPAHLPDLTPIPIPLRLNIAHNEQHTLQFLLRTLLPFLRSVQFRL